MEIIKIKSPPFIFDFHIFTNMKKLKKIKIILNFLKKIDQHKFKFVKLKECKKYVYFRLSNKNKTISIQRRKKKKEEELKQLSELNQK